MDDTERLAKAVLSRIYHGADVVFHEDQSNGEHDFDVRWPDSRWLAVETTASIVQRLEASVASVLDLRMGGPTIERILCLHPWWIVPRADARINNIRANADKLLAEIESAGLMQFSLIDVLDFPAVDRIVNGLGVEYGVAQQGSSGNHTLSSPSAEGGFVSTGPLVHAVELEMRKPDNLNKLKRAKAAGATEAHLFIEVHPRNYLPWKGLVDCSIPAAALGLPNDLDVLWAAALDRNRSYRVWRYLRASGWDDLGSI